MPPIDNAFVLVFAVFLFAGAVKGTLGIGLPTISVGLMSQFLPPQTAIALVVFPIILSNIWQVFREKAGWQTVRKYWILMATLACSLWLTTQVSAGLSSEALLVAIGVAIVTFAASSLIGRPPQIPDRHDRIAQTAAGLSAGVLGGFTSIWSPPFVTYLVARRTDADEFVRATGWFILIGGVPLAIGFWQTGLLNGATAPLSLAMVVPSLIGFALGERLRGKLSPDGFRKAILWMFLIMGLNLIRRALV